MKEADQVLQLGMILDLHLTFKNQCQFVSEKITSALAALFKIHSMIPREAVKSIYFSLISRHLHFMSGIWGTAAMTNLKPVQVLQNRALKLVYYLV